MLRAVVVMWGFAGLPSDWVADLVAGLAADLAPGLIAALGRQIAAGLSVVLFFQLEVGRHQFDIFASGV